MGLMAPRSVGALSFWSHTGAHFAPVELLPETRVCPAQGMAGLGVLLCISHGLRLGGREQVGGGKGVGGECKAGPCQRLAQGCGAVPELPKGRVVGACSSSDLFCSQEWLGVEGISKHISLQPPAMGRNAGIASSLAQHGNAGGLGWRRGGRCPTSLAGATQGAVLSQDNSQDYPVSVQAVRALQVGRRGVCGAAQKQILLGQSIQPVPAPTLRLSWALLQASLQGPSSCSSSFPSLAPTLPLKPPRRQELGPACWYTSYIY